MKPNHKKHGEEADAMIVALQQEAQGTSEEQSGDNVTAITSNSTDADEAQPTETTAENTDAGTPEPSTPPEDSVAAVDEEAVDLSKALADIKSELAAANQRWKVAQGMIEKKDSELEQMRTLLAGLASQQHATPDANNSAPETPAKLVTAAEIEDFGQPMYDFIAKVATDVTNGLLTAFDSKLNTRVASVEQSVDSVREASTKTAAQHFEEQLTAMVPDWTEINLDPGFSQWVAVVDEYAGVPRIKLLTDAYEAMDAKRTAVFFNKYKESIAPPATPEAAPAPKAPDPAKHISPGKSKASVQNATGGQDKTWTRQEIAQLYDDHRSGRITHDEFAKAERDIFKAQREGRIAS